MKEEMDGEVFISRQSWRFLFVDNMIKEFFPICTLNWRVNNYVSRQGKAITRKNEITMIVIQNFSVWFCTFFLKSLTVCSR